MRKKGSIQFFEDIDLNLKFNFDMYHGCGLLDKAINLLDDRNKHDFKKFVNRIIFIHSYH